MILGMGLDELYSRMAVTTMGSGKRTEGMVLEKLSNSAKREDSGLKRKGTGKMMSLRRITRSLRTGSQT